ncbi:MAG: hypothetical protein E7Z89_04660 [Cyanobacteria bacterium SIG28]|nr:hypothetical protein [Cyanobacteria bacterium SIG28]
MDKIKKIGFWGYPNPAIVEDIRKKYPQAEWIDLDIDFSYPKTNILPEAYCKIIRNIIDNAIYLKPDLIVAPIGKDKCDSGWFASKILADKGFNVIQSIYEDLSPKREIKICESDLPLYEKVTLITDSIINPALLQKPLVPSKTEYNQIKTSFTPGFWGVPPNDMELLKLFPNNTKVYGWIRCVEAGTPADLDLEMYVDENIPTVFYAQAFCAKSQLAKYLADKYNGLYIDIDDYASNSIKAKVEAFLRLR